MEITVRQRVAATTIVEYSDHKQTANHYPYRIVSPSAPSRCCAVEMEQVGDEHVEGEWPFVYMRCCQCGFTIRRFESADSLFGRSIGETVGVDVDVVLDLELGSFSGVDRLPARQDRPSFLPTESPVLPLRELRP